MMRNVRNRWVRVLVPWGMIGMLGLVVATEWFVSGGALRFMDSTELDWFSSGRATARKAAGFEILCFGDSMLKFGIAPRVLESKLGRKVYNLALLDGKPALTYLLFRRAIEAGAQPEALVVDFAPEGLNQPAWHLLLNPHWNALLANPREALELAQTYSDREFFGHLLLAWVLPSFRCRGQVRSEVLAALEGLAGPNPEKNRTLRRNWQVNRGGILLPKQPDFHGDVPPQCVNDLLNSEFVARPENARYVRRLLRLAAEHKIEVYWLLPPNVPKVVAARDGNGVHAKYNRFVRAMLAQFPNLVVIDARHAGYHPDVFVDPVHLDRDGAVALSLDVAEVLQNALIHAEPVERWVELPAYRNRPVARALEDVNQSRAALRLDDLRLRR